ncbi:MAG: hypothetical protein LBB40_01645 [Holophagales bacterium]|jgi:hypothetical protein|nr:hypothetical protein [Holophagales bacterium]
MKNPESQAIFTRERRDFWRQILGNPEMRGLQMISIAKETLLCLLDALDAAEEARDDEQE